MTTQLSHNQICDLLVDYAANSITMDEVCNQLDIAPDRSGADLILSTFQKDWDEAPCDEEGPNAEQDAYLDQLLDETTDSLIALR